MVHGRTSAAAGERLEISGEAPRSSLSQEIEDCSDKGIEGSEVVWGCIIGKAKEWFIRGLRRRRLQQVRVIA